MCEALEQAFLAKKTSRPKPEEYIQRSVCSLGRARRIPPMPEKNSATRKRAIGEAVDGGAKRGNTELHAGGE